MLLCDLCTRFLLVFAVRKTLQSQHAVPWPVQQFPALSQASTFRYGMLMNSCFAIRLCRDLSTSSLQICPLPDLPCCTTFGSRQPAVQSRKDLQRAQPGVFLQASEEEQPRPRACDLLTRVTCAKRAICQSRRPQGCSLRTAKLGQHEA